MAKLPIVKEIISMLVKDSQPIFLFFTIFFSLPAVADTVETMRMYDKRLSKILVEAAKSGSFIDLEKTGRSIGVPELANEIDRDTKKQPIKNRKRFSGTYHINQSAYGQYGIRSISFSQWPSETGQVKQLHFTFENNRCPSPPTYYEQFAGSRSLTAYLGNRYITVLPLPEPATAKLLFTNDYVNGCTVVIVQEFEVKRAIE